MPTLTKENVLAAIRQTNFVYPTINEKTIRRARTWFHDGAGSFFPLKLLAELFEYDERSFTSGVKDWFEKSNDDYDSLDTWACMFHGVHASNAKVVTIYTLKQENSTLKQENSSSLREAVERAARLLDGKDREVLQHFLDQRSEKYGTLIDECEVAMFG